MSIKLCSSCPRIVPDSDFKTTKSPFKIKITEKPYCAEWPDSPFIFDSFFDAHPFEILLMDMFKEILC